jgi:hypothetical protein
MTTPLRVGIMLPSRETAMTAGMTRAVSSSSLRQRKRSTDPADRFASAQPELLAERLLPGLRALAPSE